MAICTVIIENILTVEQIYEPVKAWLAYRTYTVVHSQLGFASQPKLCILLLEFVEPAMSGCWCLLELSFSYLMISSTTVLRQIFSGNPLTSVWLFVIVYETQQNTQPAGLLLQGSSVQR